METKYVRVPFEVELAKKIQNKECDGRIVTRDGRSARIVCFDVQSIYPIISLVKDDNGKEKTIDCISDGRLYKDTETKNDLILEIPEYMTFKDGDVLSFDNSIIGILKGECHKDKSGEFYCKTYACTNSKNNAVFLEYPISTIEIKKATEGKKQRIIEILKDSENPQAKEYLKRFFGIEEKKECEFKSGQPVIGIDGRGEWRYDFFSHYKPDRNIGNYVCTGRSYNKCLPYNEETAHLLGTTDNTDRDNVKV